MARSAPPAGTGSAGPIRCRDTVPRASLRCGGGMPNSPPKRDHAVEPGGRLRNIGARGGHGARMVKAQVPTSSRQATAVSRREALIIALGTAAMAAGPVLPPRALADEREVHGISAFGDLKYPPDFPRFDYVDTSAPKGGMFSQAVTSRGYNGSFLTFNSLNSYILKGDGAIGMDATFTTLMERAADEPDAMYGLVARAVRISPAKLTYRFLLRPEARFHDGTRLTAHDVAFSLNILKEKGHPIITQLLRDFHGAEAIDDTSVVARFAEKRARDVPLFVAGLPIFSRAYYSTRPFDESTLDVPLGSGPYRVGRFEPGRFIEFERVKDWWGAELPVSRGLHNFDALRYEYYRDREVGFEGFTAKNYLFREEFTSRTWATRYDFPAIRDGRVKRDICPTIRRRARRAGSSIRAARSSRTAGCARRSPGPSISSGPTRTSCT